MTKLHWRDSSTPTPNDHGQTAKLDLDAELAARSGTETKTAFSLDLQCHAMTIQGGLRALSSLIAEGKGDPNNDGVGAFASDLAALVGLIADAVQPLCEGNAA